MRKWTRAGELYKIRSSGRHTPSPRTGEILGVRIQRLEYLNYTVFLSRQGRCSVTAAHMLDFVPGNLVAKLFLSALFLFFSVSCATISTETPQRAAESSRFIEGFESSSNTF